MKVDMSPEAIERRLRRVSELKNLCLSLSKSKKATHRTDTIAEANPGYLKKAN